MPAHVMAKAAMDEDSINPALKRGAKRYLQSGETLVPILSLRDALNILFQYLRGKNILVTAKTRGNKTLPKNRPPEPEKPAFYFINWFAAVIFLFAFLLYGNTLNHGFVMDDGAMITDNKTTQKGLAGIKELFQQSSVYGSTGDNYGTYRPLIMTLFAIEWHFFGNNSSPYHFVHVLLYALCCTVIFLTLKSLLADYHPFLPVIAALLFTAHPVHTEVGANIKSGDEVLSLTFCFMALLFSLRYVSASRFYFIPPAWLCFFAALLSKESAITFLVIIPLALLLFTNAGWRKIVIVSSGNLVSILIFFAVRNSVLDEMKVQMPVIDNILVSATSPGEKFGTIFYFLYYYIRLLVFPHPLTWEYGYNQIPLTSFRNPLSAGSLLLHLALGIYAVLILYRTIKQRNLSLNLAPSEAMTRRSQNLFAFLILFYLISLSIYTNISVQLASNMAERFLFTPSLAFCIALAILIMKISMADAASKTEGKKLLLTGLTFSLLLPYSVKTYSRNKDWRSNLTLFAAGVKTSSGSYRAHSAYAWENLIAGEKEKSPEKKTEYFQLAEKHFEKAVEIFDRRADDWYNLGIARNNLGKEEDAIEAYKRAVQMNKHAKAAYNLGVIHLNRQNYANSLKYFLTSYEKDSTLADVTFRVGVGYHYLKEPQKAIYYYEKFYRKNPANKDVVNNLVIAYRETGNREKEMFYYEKLSKMK